jgi:hypothetical protein
MKRTLTMSALLAVGVLAGSALTELIHAQAPQYATKQIFQTDLNNLPGQEC